MKFDGVDGTFLSVEDILYTHDKIIEESECDDDKGFIDETGRLFESSVYSVFAGFGGVEAYPTIEEKAARLCYNIITSHCFRNANKRTGLMVMLQTLDLNDRNSKFDQEELFELITSVGSGEIGYDDLVLFVNKDKQEILSSKM